MGSVPGILKIEIKNNAIHVDVSDTMLAEKIPSMFEGHRVTTNFSEVLEPQDMAYVRPQARKVLASLEAGKSAKFFMQIQVPLDFNLKTYISSRNVFYISIVLMPDGTNHSAGYLSGTKEALEKFIYDKHDPAILIDFITTEDPDAFSEAVAWWQSIDPTRR